MIHKVLNTHLCNIFEDNIELLYLCAMLCHKNFARFAICNFDEKFSQLLDRLKNEGLYIEYHYTENTDDQPDYWEVYFETKEIKSVLLNSIESKVDYVQKKDYLMLFSKQQEIIDKKIKYLHQKFKKTSFLFKIDYIDGKDLLYMDPYVILFYLLASDKINIKEIILHSENSPPYADFVIQKKLVRKKIPTKPHYETQFGDISIASNTGSIKTPKQSFHVAPDSNERARQWQAIIAIKMLINDKYKTIKKNKKIVSEIRNECCRYGMRKKNIKDFDSFWSNTISVARKILKKIQSNYEINNHKDRYKLSEKVH